MRLFLISSRTIKLPTFPKCHKGRPTIFHNIVGNHNTTSVVKCIALAFGYSTCTLESIVRL